MSWDVVHNLKLCAACNVSFRNKGHFRLCVSQYIALLNYDVHFIAQDILFPYKNLVLSAFFLLKLNPVKQINRWHDYSKHKEILRDL